MLPNEYTPVRSATLVVVGMMAAMVSSSDSMLLSGSSYFTRDLYRPSVNPDASGAHEAWLARIDVTLFTTLTFVTGLFRSDTLVSVSDTAFGGFAQMVLPIIVVLYWTKAIRTGMLVSILDSQAFYLARVFAPAVEVDSVTLSGATYFAWDYAL